MADLDGPSGDLLDRIIADPAARDAARRELLRWQGEQMSDHTRTLASAAPVDDSWTSRARPTFLYVMYLLLLWAIPMGLIAAVQPAVARNMAAGMSAYLNAIPEPLYALFGTGYLGYTVARSWAKARGIDR